MSSSTLRKDHPTHTLSRSTISTLFFCLYFIDTIALPYRKRTSLSVSPSPIGENFHFPPFPPSIWLFLVGTGQRKGFLAPVELSFSFVCKRRLPTGCPTHALLCLDLNVICSIDMVSSTHPLNIWPGQSILLV